MSKVSRELLLGVSVDKTPKVSIKMARFKKSLVMQVYGFDKNIKSGMFETKNGSYVNVVDATSDEMHFHHDSKGRAKITFYVNLNRADFNHDVYVVKFSSKLQLLLGISKFFKLLTVWGDHDYGKKVKITKEKMDFTEALYSF